MKHLLSLIIILNTFFVVAQDNKSALSEKAKMLCKTWIFSEMEEFSKKYSPTDAQKEDQMVLMEDGAMFLTKNGENKKGSWTLSKDDKWIMFTTEEEETLKFEIKSLTQKNLTYEYQDPDLIRATYTYTAK